MTMFRFKPSLRQCPHTMTAQTIAKVVIREYQCMMAVNHEGFHRSEEGVVWDNTDYSREPVHARK